MLFKALILIFITLFSTTAYPKSSNESTVVLTRDLDECYPHIETFGLLNCIQLRWDFKNRRIGPNQCQNALNVSNDLGIGLITLEVHHILVLPISEY